MAELGDLQRLRSLAIFQDLPEEEWEALSPSIRFKHFDRGEVVLRAREKGAGLHVVVSGRLKVSAYGPGGREHIFLLLNPGDLAGVESVFGVGESAFVEAHEPSRVALLPKGALTQLMERHPALGIRIIGHLARRLFTIKEKVGRLAYRDVRGRLAALFLLLSRRYGSPRDTGYAVEVRLTHEELAAMIGANREAVTVALSRMRREGLVAVEDHRILIREVDALRRLTDDVPGPPSRRGPVKS